ncbi:hypothetical protein P3W45_000470 [Vairimorpha bombi]|jgi:hypothetical protein
MKIDFDIIDYPLKIKESQKPIYNKYRHKYEFRILDTLDSKMIYASRKRNSDLFILLDISDNSCKVLGYTRNSYNFIGPLDFYIDNNESLSFYSKLGDDIINGSVTRLLDTSQVIIDKFPPYNPPVLNHYETEPKIVAVKKDVNIHKKDCRTFRVYYEDEIPSEPLIIKKIVFDEINERIRIFVINLPHPILKINEINALFIQYKKDNNYVIQNDRLKLVLPLFRYFVMDGPFRKSWIPFGYDPKSNMDNYKYQIIDMRLEGTFFHLFEKDDIIKEVEKNKEWYLKKECDFKNGFFKKTLSQLVLYQQYIEFEKSEDEKGECFELFD